MYEQNFRNQAVKEVKNGSTINGSARKFGISPGTLARWIENYDKRMREMIGDSDSVPQIITPKRMSRNGIHLQSIKVLINGSVVVLKRDDVIRMLSLFNTFDGVAEEE